MMCCGDLERVCDCVCVTAPLYPLLNRKHLSLRFGSGWGRKGVGGRELFCDQRGEREGGGSGGLRGYDSPHQLTLARAVRERVEKSNFAPFAHIPALEQRLTRYEIDSHIIIFFTCSVLFIQLMATAAPLSPQQCAFCEYATSTARLAAKGLDGVRACDHGRSPRPRSTAAPPRRRSAGADSTEASRSLRVEIG